MRERVPRSRRGWQALLLGLTLVRGLIYVSVVPPWQHYDEPKHLERLYWVVESRFRSAPSEASRFFPAEIDASKCEFHLWGKDPCPSSPPYEKLPDLESLGVSSQPVYYYLTAPLQLFRYAPIETKLYVGRLASAMLYLLTVLVAHLLLRDLFPEDQDVRWIVPALIAWIPAYVDEMTGLNNDAGAVAIFSLLLWGIVRLMRNGWSPLSVVWVSGAAILAWFTKRTVAIGLPLGLVAILLSCRMLKWWAWVLGGMLAIGLIVSAVSWSGSAYWYEINSPGPEAVRAPSNGPVGQQAICIKGDRYLVQELATAQVKTLQGKTVTLGGWVRAASPGKMIRFPSLYDGNTLHTQTVTTTSEWQFRAMTMTIQPAVSVLQVRLSPQNQESVCYDGIVLAHGEFTLGEPPYFEDSYGGKGIWAGQSFVNLLSNGSGEQGWPRLQPGVSRLVYSSGLLYGADPTLFIQSVLDWKRTGGVYGAVLNNLFQSFWARFGWNHVGLAESYYSVLLIPTLLGLGGCVLLFIQSLVPAHYFSWQRRTMAFLALATLLVWGIAMVAYSHPMLSNLPRIHIAVARYTYPTIIPTMLFLYLGWRALVPNQWRRFLPVFLLMGMVWLEVASLLGAILPYYYT